jgi:RNA polymerase sigma factor (sigma-70 family)
MGRIRRWIFSPETADDIFQEACVKFMASGAVFKHPQACTKYFCRILRNLIFEQGKRAARLQYGENLPEMVCDPQEEWNRKMILDRVQKAVRQLPDRDQHLLQEYLNADYGDVKSLGRALRIPGSTMRYRVSRIFRELRAIVGEQ